MAYPISLLSERAAKWTMALWERDSSICDSYSQFTGEMRGKNEAQGFGSVAEFSVDFRILAVERGWDDLALQDELAVCDEMDSLDSLISLAICLNNRIREHRRERRSFSGLVGIPAPPDSFSDPYHTVTPVPPNPFPFTPEEPMKVDRIRITSLERRHWATEGRCYYCEVRWDIWCGTVRSGQKTRLTRRAGSAGELVFIDSGADGNFVDSVLVQQADIPIESLPSPQAVYVLDGLQLVMLTHRTRFDPSSVR